MSQEATYYDPEGTTPMDALLETGGHWILLALFVAVTLCLVLTVHQEKRDRRRQ